MNLCNPRFFSYAQSNAGLLMRAVFFFYSKCLELGGLLSPIVAADDAPQSTVLASSYPQHGVPSEVLVRTELGCPRGEASECRIAIRSASYLVNRGLGQVFLAALC